MNTCTSPGTWRPVAHTHVRLASPQPPTRIIYITITITIHMYYIINPLSLHDALKLHFTSLKTVLGFLQQRILERKFPWNWFTNTWQLPLMLKTTSSHPHPLLVENCDSNSRLVVDEDDNDKLRLERVKTKNVKIIVLIQKRLPPETYIIQCSAVLSIQAWCFKMFTTI